MRHDKFKKNRGVYKCQTFLSVHDLLSNSGRSCHWMPIFHLNLRTCLWSQLVDFMHLRNTARTLRNIRDSTDSKDSLVFSFFGLHLLGPENHTFLWNVSII